VSDDQETKLKRKEKLEEEVTR